MLIEAVGHPILCRFPGGEIRLELGKPVDVPDERAMRLLTKAATRMKPGATVRRAQRPLSHAAEVGAKVLAGFLKGRTQVNLERKARGTQRAIQVGYLVLADQQAGYPDRGRPRRIRRALGGTISESRVRKIIKGLQMSGPVLQA